MPARPSYHRPRRWSSWVRVDGGCWLCVGTRHLTYELAYSGGRAWLRINGIPVGPVQVLPDGEQPA